MIQKRWRRKEKRARGRVEREGGGEQGMRRRKNIKRNESGAGSRMKEMCSWEKDRELSWPDLWTGTEVRGARQYRGLEERLEMYSKLVREGSKGELEIEES